VVPMKFSKQHRWNFVATGKLKNMMDGIGIHIS
jgi:hypothetical protein